MKPVVLIVGIALILAAVFWMASLQPQQVPPSQDSSPADPARSVRTQDVPSAGTATVAQRNFAQPIRMEASRVEGTSPRELTSLLVDRRHRPKFASVATFKPEDEPALLAHYEQPAGLTNKLSLTWALAAIGGADAARALEDTLLADYGERTVTLKEWEVLRDTLTALGFIANRSEEAALFLIAASSEAFWKDKRTWREAKAEEEAYADKRLAGLALQALGIHSKADLDELLQPKLKKPVEEIRHLAGPITSAVFFRDVAFRSGTQELLRYHLEGELEHRFIDWCRESAIGRQWWAWGTNTFLSSTGP